MWGCYGDFMVKQGFLVEVAMGILRANKGFWVAKARPRMLLGLLEGHLKVLGLLKGLYVGLLQGFYMEASFLGGQSKGKEDAGSLGGTSLGSGAAWRCFCGVTIGVIYGNKPFGVGKAWARRLMGLLEVLL